MPQAPSKTIIGILDTYSKVLEGSKVIPLPKTGKDPKFSQNLRPISLLSKTSKLFEKVILNIVGKHTEEEGCLRKANLVSVHVTAGRCNV
jgi:hypothetical protein